ncbi:MAG: LacI family DNA-binding transcriptional regulator [Chthoniobacter sp.]|uniref:LacI family DNA-binding transcriptional regulator n=1 Tax=Chthoniobacter sp. TaxID=2510640 RepID=UPI0032AC092A
MTSPRAHTLEEVAKACRVSKMTVSRALRNQRGVSPQLAERIRTTAEKLGYRTNPALGSVMKALRQRRASDYRENLAFVWTHPSGKPLPLIVPWRDHARARAEHLGYRLDEFHLRAGGMTAARLRTVLQTRGIRGILFAPDTEPPLPRLSFDVAGFAAVLLGSSLQNRGLARVQFDHFQLIHLALRHIRKAGYRRPALLLSPSIDGRTQGRLRAGYLVHSPAPSRERSRLIFLGDIDDRAATSTWLKSRSADVAIYLQGDQRRLLESAGLRVPQKIAFVSLAREPEMIDVAGVVQSAEALGSAAVDFVAAQLQRHEFGRQPFPQKVMLEGAWLPGLTLPRRRATSRPASRPSPKP